MKNGIEECVARRKVTVQGRRADPGATRDLFQRSGGSIATDDGFGSFNEPLTISAAVGSASLRFQKLSP